MPVQDVLNHAPMLACAVYGVVDRRKQSIRHPAKSTDHNNVSASGLDTVANDFQSATHSIGRPQRAAPELCDHERGTHSADSGIRVMP